MLDSHEFSTCQIPTLQIWRVADSTVRATHTVASGPSAHKQCAMVDCSAPEQAGGCNDNSLQATSHRDSSSSFPWGWVHHFIRKCSKNAERHVKLQLEKKKLSADEAPRMLRECFQLRQPLEIAV
eukprot:6462998-Amphidinium_carterae.1